MGAGHHHHHHHAAATAQNERVLWLVLGLTFSFMLAEIIGAYITGSLALLSDAAHMFTDSAALAIALAAVRIARRPADHRLSFGYHRFEILAAAFNALLLFAVALYILFEAWQRISEPPDIATGGMIVVAVLGLIVNLIGMRLLHAGKEESLNLRGAYLEVWSDMLGSLGVIIGALVIMATGWLWVDTLVALGIGLWVVPRTWHLLKASVHILLEGVPDNVDIVALRAELEQLPGVAGIHDLHVWLLSSGKPSLTAHAVLTDGASADQVLTAVRDHLAARHDITHITIQCESHPCELADDAFHFPGDRRSSGITHHSH